MADKPYSASDPDQIAEREEELEVQREKELADLKDLLELPLGRRFIWRMLSKCHVFQTSIGPNMEALEGERNIGLQLWNEVVEAYPEMIPELLKSDYGNL